ncbi:MAG: xanthine dehydrogenase accessory protein XdhC [Azoarcus sp.]|nr:xanthine dehydrogenase accessory protein XdhC [Azoarcus sp.]
MTSVRLLDTLAGHLDTGATAVWVGVAEVRGSAPRAPGARMLVTRATLCGTIGGGHLELRAIEIARQMLADAEAIANAAALPPARLERFPLGASVGQCCGGVVKLAFDLVTPAERAWVNEARRLEQLQCDWVRLIELGGRSVSVAPLAKLSQAPSGDTTRPALAATLNRLSDLPGDSAAIANDQESGHTHLIELFRPPELHLALFGAGHVGRALVEVLARLPIRVSWIDPRESEFLAWMPRNTRPIVADCPAAEIRHLPADSAVLIATHSHALDLELLRAWLERGDFRFLGLIGSRSKRASFEARLRARGHDNAQLQRLVCPVGDPGVIGKEPEVIAIAIAAQLMALRRTSAAIGPKQHKSPLATVTRADTTTP